MKKCIVCEENLQGNQQKYCSNACKQKSHWHSKKEQPNTYHSQTIRALKRKLMFIEELGGGCIKCGYSKNIAALEFHHRDANEKEFQLDIRKLSNTSKDKLKVELAKCDLLCSNCHKEEHYTEMEIENVRSIIEPVAKLVKAPDS